MTESATPPVPTVHAPAGEIRGRTSNGVDRWLGIRYARAERFGRPTPEPRADVISATIPSAASPQVPYPDPMQILPGALTGLGVDEHCQRLSVHAPADRSPDERLPVVVFIHGGSYVTGAGDSPYYEPTLFVREQRVIWVAVTYRLGLLGYLPSSAGPGNLGLLDQREALRWVHRNIAAFGGDPDAVTVLGQSAGADAVAHLMISDGTEGLFRRIVSQSPPLGMAQGREGLSSIMGRRLDASGRATGPIDHLMAIQERIGQASALRHSPQHVGMPYSVTYGIDPLPKESETAAAWAARARDIDVLMGTNVRETAFYLPASVAAVSHRVAPVRLAVEATVRRTTRRVFTDAVTDFMHRHAAHSGHGYRYEIDWGPRSDYYGAHVIEMPLLFQNDAWRRSRLTNGLAWSEVEHRGRELRDLWGSFIRSGHIDGTGVEGLISIDPLS